MLFKIKEYDFVWSGIAMSNYDGITLNYKSMIDDAIDEYILKTGEKYDIVKDAMLYALKSGGKRIRPILTLEFCRIFGGDIDKALPFACAVEMIHAYSLIHDDLPCMDDDDMRRGKPSCHAKFGEANALLAGDALLTLAFAIAASPAFSGLLSENTCIKAVATLSGYAGADGMVGGQIMDLMYENKPMDEQTLHSIHLKKTAALIKCACKLGCLAAGASDEQTKIALDYAQNMGLAFQVVDDILDVVGDVSVLGKPAGSDVENGKTTFVTLYGSESAKRIAQSSTQCCIDILEKLSEGDYLKYMTKKVLQRVENTK